MASAFCHDVAFLDEDPRFANWSTITVVNDATMSTRAATAAIGEEHLADIEPTQYGMALFARTAVFEAVSALAAVPARYVTIVGTNSLDD